MRFYIEDFYQCSALTCQPLTQWLQFHDSTDFEFRLYVSYLFTIKSRKLCQKLIEAESSAFVNGD